ncbi:MAG: acetate--CoA ligase family protein [Candidatus Pacebacteria bacterium]|nr:acetate--CoA ligase family protein [Candidatus Paceibacterota bacterium]
MLLGFEKTKELLEKYHIPMAESLVIESAEQGIEFARRVGFPVVLKLISNDILHKIDKGLVRLDIRNENDLTVARKELSSFHVKGAKLLSQKQVSGVELFIGMKRDKSFGPVLSFGLGGIFVEILRDVVFGICPVGKEQALKMIKSVKGYEILRGYRGQAAVDIEKLAEILANISSLAIGNADVVEIDFNPVFANGSDILVADAKII